MRKLTAAVLALVGATIVVAAAGAGTDKLTTAAYLRSLGIDPGAVVVQRGTRNYAGPNCPGKGWNCTKARRVVQVATSARSRNKSECSGGTLSGDSCTIVQTSAGGTNTATCRLERKDQKAASVTQSCSITQTNTTGANEATVYEELELNGDQVSGTQQSSITQTNGSGANNARSVQKLLEEASSGHKTAAQDQDGDQSYVIKQTASTGANTAAAEQITVQTAKAPAAVTGTQSQHGNLDGELDQTSAGISTMSSLQDETQTVRSNAGGAVVVTQVGPEDCCSAQLGNGNNSFTIIQRARQFGDDTPSETQTITYVSSGEGDWEQHSDQNGAVNEQSGDDVSVVASAQSCTGGECGQEEGFAPGDVFVSIGNGDVEWRDADGNLKETLHTGESGFTTGLDFDAAGNLYVTDFSVDKVSKFDQFGDFASSFATGGTHPESIVFDAANNAYVGHADGDADVRKFTASGAPLGSFDVATEDRGSDWIELAPDQCTLFYTSEGFDIFRYNVCTSTQLTKFVDESGDEEDDVIDRKYALQLLPDGGVVVAATSEIIRYSAIGGVVQTYDAPGDQVWFSLGLAGPAAFWAGDLFSGFVAKFDLATGALLDSFTTGSTEEGGKAGGIVVR